MVLSHLLTREPWPTSVGLRTAAAAALAALVCLAQLALSTEQPGASDYLFLTPAVVAIGVYAGRSPGLAATAVGLAFGMAMAWQAHEPLALTAVRTAVFLGVGVASSLIGEQRCVAV